MTNTKHAALSEALARYAAIAIDHGASADIQVAFDAAIETRADAAALLVGLPVTWSNGRDCFADKIAKVSASLLTITLESGKVYRFTGRYFTQGQHRCLTMIGIGEEYRDECF